MTLERMATPLKSGGLVAARSVEDPLSLSLFLSLSLSLFLSLFLCLYFSFPLYFPPEGGGSKQP